MLSLITHNEGKRRVLEKCSGAQYSTGVSDFPLWFSISCWGSVSNTRHENIIRRIVTGSHLNKSLCVFAWQGEPRAGSPPNGTPGGYCMHIRRLFAGRTSKKETMRRLSTPRIIIERFRQMTYFCRIVTRPRYAVFTTVKKFKYNLRYARDDRDETWDGMLLFIIPCVIYPNVYISWHIFYIHQFIFLNTHRVLHITSRCK